MLFCHLKYDDKMTETLVVTVSAACWHEYFTFYAAVLKENVLAGVSSAIFFVPGLLLFIPGGI